MTTNPSATNNHVVTSAIAVATHVARSALPDAARSFERSFAEGVAAGGKKHRQPSRIAMSVGATLIASHFAMSAMAQNSAQQASQPTTGARASSSSEAGETHTLEEVVVTARKREEQAQDIPISITAISDQQLEERGITSIDGLIGLAPNFDVRPSSLYANGLAVSIRGIGGFDAIAAPEYPIAIYENDVPVFRQNSALVDLVDLERVEVLRGPQGTLFGRNSTGGAVSIYTKRPEEQFSLQQRIGVGNLGIFSARTVLDTGSLGGSSWAATVAFSHKENDGYVRNTRTSADSSFGAASTNALYLALDGNLAEALSLQYTGSFAETESISPYQQTAIAVAPFTTILAASPSFGGDPAIIARERLDSVAIPTQERNNNEVMSHGVRLRWDAHDNFALRTIVGYREFDEVNHADWAGQGNTRALTPDGPGDTPLFYAQQLTPRGRTFSTELQALGSAGPVDYTIGAFYLDDTYRQGAVDFLFALFDPATGLTSVGDVDQEFLQTTKAKAVYADVTFSPSGLPQLELSGGLRYTDDEKYQEIPSTFNGFDISPIPKSDSWNDLSGAFRLNYRWHDDLITYANVSTAYRAGGFSGAAIVAYDPEVATTYELGLKSQWLDRRLLLNVAVFDTKYEDLQITQFVASVPGLITTNAAEASYQGVDFELAAELGSGIGFRANVGYVDAKYDRFPFTTAGGATTDVSEVAKFPGLSDVTGGVTLEYENSGILAQIDYSYRSKQVFQSLEQLFPFRDELEADAIGNVRARLIFKDFPGIAADDFRVELWGDNLLDEDQQIGGTDLGTFGSVVYGRPRTYGVNISVSL